MTARHRRRPVQVFAVDDGAVQLTWRAMAPGVLGLAVLDESGRAVTDPLEIGIDGGPGAVILDDLPAGRSLTVVARAPARDHPITLPVRTFDPLPGPELTRVATISDLHVGTEVFGHRGTITEAPHPLGPHPLRCSEAALDELTAWGARHLSVKGDLTNNGGPHQWEAYAGLVASARLPVDSLPGNHDTEHPSGRRGRSFGPADAATRFGLSMALPMLVRDLPGLRIVLVDTCVPGSNHGTFAHVLDDLLDALGEISADTAAIVMAHHHLHPRSGQEGWPAGISHRVSIDVLGRIAAVHPRTLVTSGHSHRHRRWEHHGITTTQVGSVKDYPGVWAGYVVAEGGLRQIVRRVERPDCLAWTDHTRRAALGAWGHIAPGRLGSRCFDMTWP